MSIPEKEKAVYEAVLRLWGQGRDMAGLRVSEIADEAGIGKGTVYEYFPSREELLAKAVLYQQEQAYCCLRDAMLAQESFEGRFSALIDTSREAMHRSKSCCFLAQSAIPESIRRMILGDEELRCRRRERLDEIIGYLFSAAFAEKRIPSMPTAEYGRMVFIGCFAAFMERLAARPEAGDSTAAEMDLRRMLLGALREQSAAAEM